MSTRLNAQTTRVSDVLNAGAIPPTASMSNPTGSIISRDGRSSETKTQYEMNGDNQMNNGIPSSEPTCWKAERNPMSCQTKTDPLDGDREVYRQRLLLNGDSRSVFSKGISLQKFPQIARRGDIPKAHPGHNFQRARIISTKNGTFVRVGPVLAEPNKVWVTVNKSRGSVQKQGSSGRILTCGGGGPPRYLLHSRNELGEEMRRSGGKFHDEGTVNPRVVHKLMVYNPPNAKNEAQVNRDLPNRRPLPRILIRRDPKSQDGKNYTLSNTFEAQEVDNARALHPQSQKRPYTEEPNARNTAEAMPTLRKVPLLYRPDANVLLSQFRHQRPVVQMGRAAVPKNDSCGRNFRFILPKQLGACRGNTVDGDEEASAANLSASEDSGAHDQNYANSFKISNFGLQNSFLPVTTETKYRGQFNSTSATSGPGLCKVFLKNPLIRGKPDASQPLGSRRVDVTERQDFPEVHRNASREHLVGNKGSHKVQTSKIILSKISELLHCIRDTLSDEFVCPTGLDLALPIWKSELDKCILSVEKIKAVISDNVKQ